MAPERSEPDPDLRRISANSVPRRKEIGMKRGVLLLVLGSAVVLVTAVAAFVGALGPAPAAASSHREAPLISDDPAADNTDVYAFVSPDQPNTVTIIANYIPFEDPAGGPNYYRFDPTVEYALNVDNDGDARDDVSYRFRFKTELKNPNTFLYNTGPIDSPVNQASNLSVRQTYTVTRVTSSGSTVLGSNLSVPPTNIGPRSNSASYDAFQGVVDLGGGQKVFAGPRDDPFFVDLGSIFDLGGLRPFNALHAIPLPTEAGVDGVVNYNTHTIAIQVPKTDLLKAPLANGTIGIYASASRPKIRVLRGDGTFDATGPEVQVSRLGNPLINEAVIPLGKKDLWNASDPRNDSQFESRYLAPELATLEDVLYPLDGPPTTGRGDLVAVLLTGVPTLNFTGTTKADLLRLNTSFTAPAVGSGNRLGLLAGELSGFPNGRRLEDDVTDIELRAIACGYGPVVGPIVESFGFCDGNGNRTPNNLVGDGVNANEKAFLPTFPYVAAPNQGYAHTGHS
jgi:hypothetical protein